MKQMIKDIDAEIESLMTQDLDQLEHRVRWIVCGRNENIGMQGIHYLNPSEAVIAEAYETACKELFEVIYLHFDNVRQLKRG